MKRLWRKFKNQAFCCFMAFLFCGGILFAGSDGGWFPWANLVGALLLGLFALIGNQLAE